MPQSSDSDQTDLVNRSCERDVHDFDVSIALGYVSKQPEVTTEMWQRTLTYSYSYISWKSSIQHMCYITRGDVWSQA